MRTPPEHPLRISRNGHGSQEVTFGLSPSYGLDTAREALHGFLRMMREHEEFEVETDRAGGVGKESKYVFPSLKAETGREKVGYGPQNIS